MSTGSFNEVVVVEFVAANVVCLLFQVMMLEIAQHIQAFLHKHDRPPISLHEEMVSEREREREREKQEKRCKACATSPYLVEEKAKRGTGRNAKEAEGARSSTNQNGEGGNLKRLIS